jgi:hypothetical protein
VSVSPLIHWLTHPLAHSLIHSLTHSLIHSFMHTITYPSIPTHSLTHSLTHHRLRCDKNDPGYHIAPHPDNLTHDKYTLCVSGIQHLYSTLVDHTRVKQCYVWIDYSCVDQDLHNLISLDYKNMEEIMRVSDCVFTPVVDTSTSGVHTRKQLRVSDAVRKEGPEGQYSAVEWTGTEHSNRGYLKRGWCLLEMLYGVSTRVYVCMYVRMYVCMHVRMYVCMYVCMYACTYVCVYAR